VSRTGIGTKALTVVAGVTTVLGFLVALLVTRDGTLLQRPPWVAGLLLVVMGGLVLWIARPVRHHLRSGRRTSVDALRAARTVVLAQAGALTGAAAAGWYLGQLLALLTDLSLVANRERLLPFGLMTVASLLLAGAGLVAQAWCRIEESDDDRRDDED
jgi:hypothetical protein